MLSQPAAVADTETIKPTWGEGGATLTLRSNVQGGVPKLELKKFCPRERKRTMHKIKRK